MTASCAERECANDDGEPAVVGMAIILSDRFNVAYRGRPRMEWATYPNLLAFIRSAL